jgi:electron-transferring-flavoprotein dehydrogenase
MSDAGGLPEREAMEFDVVIVGGGPSGLAAAIRLKQLDAGLSVVVLEKGSEVGAHIVSGAVIDPIGLDRLLPEWRTEQGFERTPVTEDRFTFMTATRTFNLPMWPMPRLMSNHGNFIVSLGDMCRWLGQKAEALGVEIYPGFAGVELLRDAAGRVTGVATGDMGVGKDGLPGPDYQRGMALMGKYTLLAEGTRGSLSKLAIAAFDLARDAEPQKYGLGFKEIWRVSPEKSTPGLVQHSLGWPLDNRTGGGSFLYHLADGTVAIGFVVHLNYPNPHLSPFEEFQRFKRHSAISGLLAGGTRLSYGARAITEGGYQSLPRMSFPGGLLLGDSAGMVNLPRIKGSHNAVLSGIAAAEAVQEALQGHCGAALDQYDRAIRDGDIGRDLRPVQNVKPLLSRFGTVMGTALAGMEMWCQSLFGRSPLGTLGHGKPDHLSTEPADRHGKIDYPRPDGAISHDRLSSVFVSNTNHAEDQPSHLRVKDIAIQQREDLQRYGGLSTRYCPAGVYEWTTDAEHQPRFVINAQNCVHCKTCDIKDPAQNITWTPPEGGGGPNYTSM